MPLKLMKTIVLIVLILLSLGAGLAKLAQLPQELAFFDAAGIGSGSAPLFGGLQVLAAGLIAWPKTRSTGLGLAAFMFACSAIMIFVAGAPGFAIFSLVPVGVALLLRWDPA